MEERFATIEDVREAEAIIHHHLSPVPLIRSYALEREWNLPAGRRVWLKDYGWTPVGSFKLMGALNWMHHHADETADRPVVAHSSGNFASGISFAGNRYRRRVIVVMPDTAPRVKCALTRAFGAEIRTYDIARDHLTGERDRLAREIADGERAVQASPYNDRHVIAGNGVGGLEIAQQLGAEQRRVSHFFCQVSGGGLMAGMALAMADAFPDCRIIGVEPDTADDFRQSLQAGTRVRLDRPTSICDGLLSYDVGEQNWPILQRLVRQSVVVNDLDTRRAMRWLYMHQGLRSEPSGTIALAAARGMHEDLCAGDGDIVIVVSGRNVDEPRFREWIDVQ